MALTPNTTFGIYEIGESIGEGGMGEVFRATDTKLKRQVAIKALPESFANDPDRLSRFQREAETLASMNHPNIAQIYGLETQGDTTALVMELIEGPTLADRIAQGPLPPEEALRIARQLIDGLEASHNKGVVHRDLKPANIKLKDDGQVKILDFGIAKPGGVSGSSGGQTPTQITPAVTETGIIMGTAAYMSPEQARGREVDERTDIWAFACVLYEMLTGQPAFGGEDVAETLARIITLEADTGSLTGIISPMVEHTIGLCLQKDLKKRIADIRDVRLALEGELESGLAGALTGATNAAQQALWRKLAVPAVVIAVALIAVFVTLTFSPAPAAPEVTRWTHILPENQTLNLPIVTSIGISPDGRTLVYGAGLNLYRRNLDELEARIVPGTDGDIPVVPSFSPDGETIIYASGRDQNTKRISANGGTAIPILDSAEGTNWADERIIYSSGTASCTISQVRATGGTPELITSIEGSTICGPAVSPIVLPGDETIIYTYASSGTRELYAYSLAEATHTPLFPGMQASYLESGHLVYYNDTLGLMARAFNPGTLEFGPEVALVRDIAFSGVLAQFRVSANGTLVYVQGSGSSSGGNVLITLDENDRLETLDLPPDEYLNPEVSPDGSQVAVQVGSGDEAEIYIYDLSGSSEIRQLTFEGGNNPTWSPDGEWIAYASDRDGSFRIWQQRADGTGTPEALTTPEEGHINGAPKWFPDGELLTFGVTDADGWRETYSVTPPDGPQEIYVNSEGEQGGHDISPQGNAIAYSQGGGAVILEPIPMDGSRTRISVEDIISYAPIWSRDGRKVLYQTFDGTVIEVKITVPGFTITGRRTLAVRGVPQFGISSTPDGKWLMAAVSGGNAGDSLSSAVQIVVVQNWIEDLKRLVPVE